MKIAESTTFEKRLVEAFGGATLPKIAEKLAVNYHTLRNWAKGRSDIPLSELIKIAELTKISLNWLLAGQGDMFVPSERFNLERSVEIHADWQDVLLEWYVFEGREAVLPEQASFMGGWAERSKQERMDAVRDLKKVLDRDNEK